MSENDVEKLDSAEPSANANSIYTSSPAPQVNSKSSTWRWIGLGSLVLLSLMVIFVLPNIVSEYELPLERRVDVTQTASSVSAPAETAISPFEEAQRANQRREAQEVLAELLEIQAELEALEVEQWGQESHEAALARASIGDEYYRTQEFEIATSSYAEARDQLGELRQSIPTVFARLLEEAQNALDAGDAETAAERFSMTLLLDPESQAAEIGLTRARTLDEVTALLAQAEDQAEDNELEAARASLQNALDLDAYYEEAQQRLAAVNSQILANEFSRIMSAGYTALDNNDPDAAIAQFQRAASLGVNDEQARAAIVQTETNLDLARINRLRESIAIAESNENWQSAVTDYDAVLAIDPNLTFAIEGRDYAAKRAQLNRLLVEAINNPERFAEDAVYNTTIDVYYTGRAIENPGPKLVGQLDELQVLLENSQIPIDVRLVSDNLTDVTVLRIGQLGLFEQTSLALKPGNYVAVGRRNGYREVRREFTVGFGKTPEQVIVQCEERVYATNGR